MGWDISSMEEGSKSRLEMFTGGKAVVCRDDE